MSLIESAVKRAQAAAQRTSRPSRSAERKDAALDAAQMAPPRQFQPCQLDPVAMERHCVLSQTADDVALRAYKILRTRLLQRLGQNSWQSLAVTGTEPEQGKTLTSINLAIALAQDPNTHVFLVDLDLQRPRIAEYLGIQFEKGLGHYLSGEAELEQVIYDPGIARLSIIPNTRLFEHASELLTGPRMLELKRALGAESPRRIVIYDMPPLLLSDDVLTFAPQVDGLLLVVSEGSTARSSLEKSKEFLSEMNIIGVVLNRSAERDSLAYY